MARTKKLTEHDLLITALAEISRHRREALKLSQHQLAARSGLYRSYIGDFERDVRSISVKNLCQLAQGLDIPVSTLLRLAEQQAAKETSNAPKKITKPNRT